MDKKSHQIVVDSQQHSHQQQSHHLTAAQFKAHLLGLGFDLVFKVCALLSTGILFILVALAAWKLGVFIHWIDGQGASAVLVWMLKIADYSLVALDLWGLVVSTKKHLQ